MSWRRAKSTESMGNSTFLALSEIATSNTVCLASPIYIVLPKLRKKDGRWQLTDFTTRSSFKEGWARVRWESCSKMALSTSIMPQLFFSNFDLFNLNSSLEYVCSYHSLLLHSTIRFFSSSGVLYLPPSIIKGYEDSPFLREILAMRGPKSDISRLILRCGLWYLRSAMYLR